MFARTILIVEDEPLIRLNLADTFAEEGYLVLEASSVLEAIALLGRYKVDAVVTDVDLAGTLTGVHLLDFLETCRKGFPVVVTSGGHSAEEFKHRANVCFFAKPYDPDRVFLEIDRKITGSPRSHLFSLVG